MHYDNGFCARCHGYEPAVLNGDVYEISNAGNLYWFAAKVNAGETGINGRLTEEIVVNEGTLTAETTDARAWTPIGTESGPYTGTFDGGGHTVSGLYFNDSNADYVGLFGSVAEGGTVENVTVSDTYFCGKWYVGGLVGLNNGTVKNCTNEGTVSGKIYVGGVAGSNAGTVDNCNNSGTVSGSDRVGGVAGSNYGTVTNCKNSGTVSGGLEVGGVAGHNSGTVDNCNNSGTVSGSGNYVGGVAGYNYSGSTVTNCKNSGAVSGARYVGGVAGDNYQGTAENCSNSGAVSGEDYVGGVAGRNSGTVTNCYNRGNVNGSNHVGGVAGRNLGATLMNTAVGTVTNCYFDSTVYTGDAIGSNDGTATKVESKATEAFASGEVAYLLSQGENGSIWGQTIGTEEYPVLGGKTVYPVYNCSGELSGYTNTQTSGQPQHIHGTPSYTWSEDPITLTVSVSCTACGETFTGSTTNMDVTTSADGFTTTYTAAVTLDGRNYTDSRTFTNDVTSVNITWGEMDFTYTDESGWNNPDTAYVSVENTGNTAVTVTYSYVTERTDITGTFFDGTSTVAAPVSIDAESTKKIWLRLDGKPSEALSNTTIGSVKLTIE